MNKDVAAEPIIHGMTTPEFQKVRGEFERNFVERNEEGAACCVYFRGAKVVDLWGGYRAWQSREPWNEDTLALVFSVTKGMAAAAMAVAHSRGLFELDQRVAKYWPEFAQSGKQEITVRQLLAHQAGLISVDAPLSPQVLGSLDQMAEIIARQKPAWKPGSRHGYHTLTLGWYQNELLRRVDPRHRSLGTFFQDEIAQPLVIEFYIGLPAEIDEQRLATIKGFQRRAILRHLDKLPSGFVLAAMWPWSLAARSVRHPRFHNPADIGGSEYRSVEIPSANGIGHARAIAKIYGVLAGDGQELGISAGTREELFAKAAAPPQGSRDIILQIDTLYSFGFSRPSLALMFGSDGSAFGAPGAGGSFGMADPNQQLGYAYVTNKMGFHLFDDPREKAIRDAVCNCVAVLGERKRVA